MSGSLRPIRSHPRAPSPRKSMRRFRKFLSKKLQTHILRELAKALRKGSRNPSRKHQPLGLWLLRRRHLPSLMTNASIVLSNALKSFKPSNKVLRQKAIHGLGIFRTPFASCSHTLCSAHVSPPGKLPRQSCLNRRDRMRQASASNCP